MNGESRLSVRRHRLALLLVALALTNLATFDQQGEPSCNCSSYPGRMTLEPPYVFLQESETKTVIAGFPESVQWSIGEMPTPDVVASISASVDQGSFEVTLTAADRIDQATGSFPDRRFGRFTTEFILRPVRRTEVEVRAEPDDSASAPESRFLTVFGEVPDLQFTISGGGVSSTVDDIRLLVIAAVNASGTWTFEFDISDAPSLRTPLVTEQGPAKVLFQFPLADVLDWRVVPRPCPPGAEVYGCIEGNYCEIRVPIHFTATDGQRILHETPVGLITANLLAGRLCPQPEDFRN